MNPAPIKPLISTSDLDKIDVRVGTILPVEDVAHSGARGRNAHQRPSWTRQRAIPKTGTHFSSRLGPSCKPPVSSWL